MKAEIIDRCPFCGETEDEEEQPLMLLYCPQCGREGCQVCMPAGRGCMCPECEMSEDEE